MCLDGLNKLIKKLLFCVLPGGRPTSASGAAVGANQLVAHALPHAPVAKRNMLNAFVACRNFAAGEEAANA
jgi:hypothetical protein